MLRRDQRLSGASASPGEFRTEFQRDRDRILYSSQFRRLSGITQVTTPSELHVFHNRLTHTLEVAQLGRRIAERANARTGVDPDVCEAAALAHDLGHPPFGHNGERVLNSLAQAAGEQDGFEGNAQSLRILLKLALHRTEVQGLDLTAATLRASIKYPWTCHANPDRPSKFGVYSTEVREFLRIWYGLPAFQPTLEAQIMDWADDIAYSTHDFYDFALAGLIPIAALKTARPDTLRAMLQISPEASQASDEAYQQVARSFKLLPDPPLESNTRLTSDNIGRLKRWVSLLIDRYAASEISFEEDRLIKNGSIDEEVAILKAITYHYAIGSPALAIRHEGERRILGTLFEVVNDSANSREKKLLGADAKSRLSEGLELPTRIALDIISSLTDAQTIATYQKLTGASPISVLDYGSFIY